MKKSSLLLPVFCLFIFGLLAFSAPGQFFKTSIRITVLDELGNQVEGAKVSLYNNQEDYRQEENAVAPAEITDRKGRVKFSDLEPKVYFVDVKKGDMTNAGGGAKTDTLQENRLNKVNIIIE